MQQHSLVDTPLPFPALLSSRSLASAMVAVGLFVTWTFVYFALMRWLYVISTAGIRAPFGFCLALLLFL